MRSKKKAKSLTASDNIFSLSQLSQLPDELLINIFRFLSDPKDLIALSKTSKRFRGLAFLPQFWLPYQNYRYHIPPHLDHLDNKSIKGGVLSTCFARLKDGYFLTGHKQHNTVGSHGRLPSPDYYWTLRMWHIDKKKEVNAVKLSYKYNLCALCVVGDGHIVTNDVINKTNSLLIWNIPTLKLEGELTDGKEQKGKSIDYDVHKGFDYVNIYNFDNRYLIFNAGCDDVRNTNSLKIWDFTQRKCIHTLQGSSPVVKIDDNHFASFVVYPKNLGIRIWDVNTGECSCELQPSSIASGYDIHPAVSGIDLLQLKGSHIIFGTMDRGHKHCILIWNFRNNELNKIQLKGRLAKLVKLDEEKFITSSYNRTTAFIQIWTLEGKCLNTIEVHEEFDIELINLLVLTGGYIAYVPFADDPKSNNIKIFHADKKELVQEIEIKSDYLKNDYFRDHIIDIVKLDDSRLIIFSHSAMKIITFPQLQEDRLNRNLYKNNDSDSRRKCSLS